MAGPFSGRKATASEDKPILPSAQEVAANQSSAAKKPKPAAETRTEKVLIYVTPTEKKQVEKLRGKVSESKFLHPVIKNFIK